jgi:hypothetical protein
MLESRGGVCAAAIELSASTATAGMAKPVALSSRQRRGTCDLLVPTERTAASVRITSGTAKPNRPQRAMRQRAKRRPARSAERRTDG